MTLKEQLTFNAMDNIDEKISFLMDKLYLREKMALLNYYGYFGRDYGELYFAGELDILDKLSEKVGYASVGELISCNDIEVRTNVFHSVDYFALLNDAQRIIFMSTDNFVGYIDDSLPYVIQMATDYENDIWELISIGLEEYDNQFVKEGR